MFKKPVTTYQREIRRRCLVFFLYNFYDVLNVVCIFNNRYGFMMYLKSVKNT